MGKESKFCTGVLLRANLKGHGHPILFRRLAWMVVQLTANLFTAQLFCVSLYRCVLSPFKFAVR